jgi:hypothetical protein
MESLLAARLQTAGSLKFHMLFAAGGDDTVCAQPFRSSRDQQLRANAYASSYKRRGTWPPV